tara:strand:+ start:224 stop:472 length:249 start_codon:yes stop_codon:yes gene_type:complete
MAETENNDLTFNELFDMCIRMADDLQEYVNAAEEAGSSAPATQEILDDWNGLYRRSPFYWQTAVLNDDKSTGDDPLGLMDIC